MKVSSPKQGAAQPRAAPKVTGSRFDRRPQSPELGGSRSKVASPIRAGNRHGLLESPGPQDRWLAALRRGMKRIFPRATPAQAAALDKWLTEPAEFPGQDDPLRRLSPSYRREFGNSEDPSFMPGVCESQGRAPQTGLSAGMARRRKMERRELKRTPRLSVAGLGTLRIRPGMARTGPSCRIA
jgi:hypothetical protein